MSADFGCCDAVSSTRNLLETPSVAQSLDGSRLKGACVFPAAQSSPAVRRTEDFCSLPAAPYSVFAESVSQPETWPPLKPFKNQRLRCSEVPWVKESGTT